MDKTLYDLTDEYKFLEFSLEEGEEENTETLENELSKLKVQIEDKVENVAKYILSLNANVDAIKNEETRLSLRRKTIENRTSWLKNYLLQEMTASNTDKVQRNVVTVSMRTNPVSVNVVNLDAIPQEYRRVIPEEWQPDKKAIAEHFKNSGEVVAGVEMITGKKSIVIK